MSRLVLEIEGGTFMKDTEFQVVVRVPDLPQESRATVRLEQVDGVAPFYTATREALPVPGGERKAVFQVKLPGLSGDTVFAVLLAEAQIEAGPPCKPTAKGLRVTG